MHIRGSSVLLIVATTLNACAVATEIPESDAVVKDADAAIAIGQKGCLVEWKAQGTKNWHAKYSKGGWRVMGGQDFGMKAFTDCFEFVVEVDAKTGKPGSCSECVVVT